jgi:hypothetical protein
MDPNEVLQLITGHTNIITKEVQEIEKYFSKLQCSYCGGSCRPITNNKKLFDDNSILPNFIAHCNDCEAQFTPYTKIEIRGPKKNPLEEDHNLTKNTCSPLGLGLLLDVSGPDIK